MFARGHDIHDELISRDDEGLSWSHDSTHRFLPGYAIYEMVIPDCFCKSPRIGNGWAKDCKS